MRLLMNAELSTTYAEWKKVYDGHKWARDEANMKEFWLAGVRKIKEFMCV